MNNLGYLYQKIDVESSCPTKKKMIYPLKKTNYKSESSLSHQSHSSLDLLYEKNGRPLN